jgi:hypothetical protein
MKYLIAMLTLTFAATAMAITDEEQCYFVWMKTDAFTSCQHDFKIEAIKKTHECTIHVSCRGKELDLTYPMKTGTNIDYCAKNEEGKLSLSGCPKEESTQN